KIIGTGFKAGQLVVPATPRRDDQHGKSTALLAPGTQQTQTIELRQTQVHQRSVVAFGRAQKLGLAAVRAHIDSKTGGAQGLRQLRTQYLIVFDDQQFQSSSPSS